MLYKTLLVTYALALAGFCEAAPAVARNAAAQDVCTTQSDCSDGTYCIRATPETEYTCMTQQQAQAIINETPEATKRGLLTCLPGPNCPDWMARPIATKMKRSGCASSEDCGEGTHCVQLGGEAEYTCRTTQEIIASAP